MQGERGQPEKNSALLLIKNHYKVNHMMCVTRLVSHWATCWDSSRTSCFGSRAILQCSGCGFFLLFSGIFFYIKNRTAVTSIQCTSKLLFSNSLMFSHQGEKEIYESKYKPGGREIILPGRETVVSMTNSSCKITDRIKPKRNTTYSLLKC